MQSPVNNTDITKTNAHKHLMDQLQQNCKICGMVVGYFVRTCGVYFKLRTCGVYFKLRTCGVYFK